VTPSALRFKLIRRVLGRIAGVAGE